MIFKNLWRLKALCGLNRFEETIDPVLIMTKIAQRRLNNLFLALCLTIYATIKRHRNEAIRAVELLGLAYNHPASPTAYLDMEPLSLKLQEQLQAELGEVAYDTAWERGKALDLETTVQALIEEFATNDDSTT